MSSYLMNGMVISPGVGVYVMIYVSGFIMLLHFTDWFILWVGLELIMYGFLAMMFESDGLSVEEANYSYFFIQSIGSGGVLGVIFLGGSEFLVEFLLVLKLGVGPFYYWYVSVMVGVGWWGCYLLMSLQKVGPLLLLREMDLSGVWVVALVSLVIGVVGSIGCENLKMLLGYSSLHYMGWVLLIYMLEGEVWVLYFGLYSLMMFLVVASLNAGFVNSVGEGDSLVKMDMLGVLLMMGGIPPTVGFLLKWVGLMSLIGVDLFMFVLLVLFSVMMCYVYFRIMYSLLMGGTMLSMVGAGAKSMIMWWIVLLSLFCMTVYGVMLFSSMVSLMTFKVMGGMG